MAFLKKRLTKKREGRDRGNTRQTHVFEIRSGEGGTITRGGSENEGGGLAPLPDVNHEWNLEGEIRRRKRRRAPGSVGFFWAVREGKGE